MCRCLIMSINIHMIHDSTPPLGVEPLWHRIDRLSQWRGAWHCLWRPKSHVTKTWWHSKPSSTGSFCRTRFSQSFVMSLRRIWWCGWGKIQTSMYVPWWFQSKTLLTSKCSGATLGRDGDLLRYWPIVAAFWKVKCGAVWASRGSTVAGWSQDDLGCINTTPGEHGDHGERFEPTG